MAIKILAVSDMMTKETITASPETSLIDIAEILTTHRFNGVPIVDKEKRLVGLVTEYDLISGASGVHLPTLQSVLGSLPVLDKDKQDFNEDIASVMKLTARDVMNKTPMTLLNTSTYDEAVKAFQTHHAINPIPVVNNANILVGVISRYDILKPLVN